ncbi:MAG: Excinuclease ABC, C subunit-like [Rhodanobacteraceae bacterium]|jgi:putative endonuclease|nr:MAG: Excinuclease ABC, C subunit-like [Rhodanobacteraceae bacterium]
MGDKQPVVYILANARNGVLYIGVASNLIQRIWQHRNDLVAGFSKRYRAHLLVYFEQHSTMDAAITREKRIKKWNRAWKLELIEKHNPYWHDLYPGLSG